MGKQFIEIYENKKIYRHRNGSYFYTNLGILTKARTLNNLKDVIDNKIGFKKPRKRKLFNYFSRLFKSH